MNRKLFNLPHNKSVISSHLKLAFFMFADVNVNIKPSQVYDQRYANYVDEVDYFSSDHPPPSAGGLWYFILPAMSDAVLHQIPKEIFWLSHSCYKLFKSKLKLFHWHFGTNETALVQQSVNMTVVIRIKKEKNWQEM